MPDVPDGFDTVLWTPWRTPMLKVIGRNCGLQESIQMILENPTMYNYKEVHLELLVEGLTPFEASSHPLRSIVRGIFRPYSPVFLIRLFMANPNL